MHAAEWIALGIGAATILINLITLAIGYGVLRGSVSAMSGRLTALEAEIGALAGLQLQVARVETRLDGLVEQFKDLNASIRWMRDPASYEPIMPAGVRAPRKRTT